MTKKKPEPNPIEEAIGDRAKPKTPAEKATEAMSKEGGDWGADTRNSSQDPAQIPNVPSPQEILTLEELNRQTEERLQDQYPEEPEQVTVAHTVPKVPVLQPDPPPVTKTSSPESPVETINKEISEVIEKAVGEELPVFSAAATKRDFPCKVEHIIENSPQKIDDITVWVCPDCGVYVRDKALQGLPCRQHTLASESEVTTFEEKKTMAELLGQKMNEAAKAPAEDIELTALRKYILEDGFVLATVAFHIVSLCAQPMTTPSTTTWDFKDRAMIPDMVLSLLNQPGYLESIWPSLKIVMGDNKGNSAWTAGISTTIAFFDVVRSLPVVEELKNDTEKKS